jgi:ubiquinone/menaquinone biosynthesis C-methylase UbiE
MTTIEKDVLGVLESCMITENNLFLPNMQLSRDLYVKVNKVLETLGGKWNRKAKAHLFDFNPQDMLDTVLAAGAYTDWKKELQFFETPKELVSEMLKYADLEKGSVVLEPSAGKGAIAEELAEEGMQVHCVEINPVMAEELNNWELFRSVTAGDFLQIEPEPIYDGVVMNPPFTRQQDIDHVLHAYRFLKPGGVLVSVMSEGTFLRDNKKAKDFREWLYAHSIVSVVENDAGAFKKSGTLVRTRFIKIYKEKG